MSSNVGQASQAEQDEVSGAGMPRDELFQEKGEGYLAEDSTVKLMQLLVFFFQTSQSNLCHHRI